MPPKMRLFPSVLAAPCWVWVQNEAPGYQTSSLHRPPGRWEPVMFRRPSSPKREKKTLEASVDLKRPLLQLWKLDVAAPCAGCAPGLRRSRWWQIGSGRASAGHGSPCGSGSAENADPPPDDGGEPTHLHCSQRTSYHHRPRSPAEVTATCTSPGHQSLQRREETN